MVRTKSLEGLTWCEVTEYLKRDDRLLLVVGSCEQHGRHLPFTVDAIIAEEIGTRAAGVSGVLMAPALKYGMSLHHMSFPGTLSLRPETLVLVMGDILDSAHRHGFRRIAVLNGHGGNRAALHSAGISQVYAWSDLELKVIHWMDDPQVVALVERLFSGGREYHASAVETSCMLAIDAERVQMKQAKCSAAVRNVTQIGPQTWRRLYPYGAAGIDPRLGTVVAGTEILDTAARAVCEHLKDWKQSTRRSQK